MEQFCYLLPNPKPVIFFIELQTRTCPWSQLLMDAAVATAEGSSIPWLYSCIASLSFLLILMERTFQLFLCTRIEWRSAEPSFTVAVLLTALPPFQVSFSTETELSWPRTWLLSFYSTYLHLPGCSSQASWTNTSEWHRWDTIIILSIKNYLCTDYGGKSCCLIMATVDLMAVEVQGVAGKSFFIQREIML